MTDADRTLVTVNLSNCAEQDAQRVLSYLTSVFSDQAPTDNGPDSDAEPTTVWTAQLDVSAGSSSSGNSAEPIEGEVTVGAQGVPHEVNAVRKALAEAYDLKDAGSASGDQELDSQFTLSPR
ncbi:hypothetical protein [Streptomyces sp. NPDC046939]|uniref:hypothetical protein n=1 Tax=Streptomyces sp. NPDC046939 TaxID=3155376 RepID=UPI0033F8E5AB